MEPVITNEVVKDQGALNSHPSYTDKDFEGHRAHTVYVGVHIPGTHHHRHPRHRRHRHHHRPHRKEGGEATDPTPLTPPAQRVHFILGEDEDESHESHPLFSEMEELYVDGDEVEWRETARWIKFEEDVEEGGKRWSKPHVATLSLHSLFELRSCILNGTVMLDVEGSSLDQIVDLVLENAINTKQLPEEKRNRAKETLLRRHRHLHDKREGGSSKGSRIPLIRSLADIGRVHSSSKSMQDGFQTVQTPVPTSPSSLNDPPQFGRFLLPGSANNQQAQNEGMEQSSSGGSLAHNGSGDSNKNSNTDGMGGFSSNADMHQSKGNQHFMKKIPAGAEASNILVGEVDFLEKAISAFIRLTQSVVLGDLTEVPVPTRFMFILLGPQGNIARYHEIGRAIATLMSDEVFHDVAYKGKSRQDLLAGVDEFLDFVTVLPPGEWDPSIRIEPPNKIPSQDYRKVPEQAKEDINEEEEEEKEREQSGLKRTGRLFGGLVNDFKRKAPWYLSDFKDALAIQCLASFFFLYFACLTPIITFGGLLGEATENRMAAMESLVSGFICGLLYALFSGQPLTVLSSTGPVLVFETIAYSFCKDHDLDYLEFRLWIGVWTGVILLIMVAFDASAFVCYITRFTEENFACLISLIFIYNAIVKVWEVDHKYPLQTNPVASNTSDCYCEPSVNSINADLIQWAPLSKESCLQNNGTLAGPACPFVPDVFLMSLLLFSITFLMSYGLKEFKNTSFFPTRIRQIINDFAVIFAILLMTLLDYKVGLNTPKLEVPDKFEPTWSGRTWWIPPFGKNVWWTTIVALVPALLAVILIFMDQQITAVIVNRKEHKLKKGCGYHLDLFVLAILIIVCSIMGLPWFVAGTVLSVTHVNTLKVESACAAPGEKPQFLGVREQRVTHLLIFIMIGFSVALTPVLRFIPMPVLFGVFLYMGISSLKGLQFFDRILIMFMPAKYQPDYMFLRQVPLKRVHMFTSIQLICLVLLWVLKAYKPTSIAFPIMLVFMLGVRKLLDFIFTQRELTILDDVMPESTRRKREEEAAQRAVEAEMIPIGEGAANLQISLANGSIMKIPMDTVPYDINITEEMNKTGIWKQVNSENIGNGTHNNPQPTEPSKKELSHTKKRGTKKDALNDEERKRLSTMAEEEDDEEDGPIMIKIESPTPNVGSPASDTAQPGPNQNETSV